jgi:hypothetical protein
VARIGNGGDRGGRTELSFQQPKHGSSGSQTDIAGHGGSARSKEQDIPLQLGGTACRTGVGAISRGCCYDGSERLGRSKSGCDKRGQ